MGFESREKISKANKGRIHSPEKRKNMGSPKGLKNTKETIQKRIQSLNKPITQYDLNNNFIKDWESTKQAALSLGIDKSGITNVLKGKYKKSSNFIWKYKK